MNLNLKNKKVELIFTTRKIVNLTKDIKEKNLEDLYFKIMNEKNIEALATLINEFAENTDTGLKAFNNIEEVYEFMDSYMLENQKTYDDLFNENISRKSNSQNSRSRDGRKSEIKQQQEVEKIANKLKQSKTLEENILNLEPLAYYYGLKPHEFWNGRYKEILLYCEIQTEREKDKLKEKINVYEAVTDKMIQTDGFLYKKPKIVPLKEMFKNLFK